MDITQCHSDSDASSITHILPEAYTLLRDFLRFRFELSFLCFTRTKTRALQAFLAYGLHLEDNRNETEVSAPNQWVANLFKKLRRN